jgi:hypothetical protein
MPQDTSIPRGLCQCGCGQETRFATRNDPHLGLKAGERNLFVRGHQNRLPESVIAAAFWGRVDQTGGDDACWTWTNKRTGQPAKSYGRFKVNAVLHRVHRLSWELTYGPIPEGLVVCHHCDNPICVNPRHLFLGTTQDNSIDMVRKGRHARNLPVYRGEANSQSKLTDDGVRAIRRRYAAGETERDLAAAYGVSERAIYFVVRHQTWRHVDDAILAAHTEAGR